MTIEFMAETEVEDGVTVLSIWDDEHQHYHPVCAAASPGIADLIIQAFKEAEINDEVFEESQRADAHPLGEAV